MNIKWVKSSELLSAGINKIEKKINILLDIGCGINPQSFVIPKIHICCEPYDEYVKILNNNINNKIDDRDYIVLNADWNQITNIFLPKSVDTIILIDIIEHLEKSESRRLIKKTEQIAKKQVIIFTPLGFVPQIHDGSKDAWGLDGGAWQEHKSGWTPKDFDESWEFIASKDFHKENNKQEKFEKPFGAFWAIKNIKTENKLNKISKRKQIHQILDKIIDVYNSIINKNNG